MANTAVASWQTCIKMLQQLVGDTCTAPDTSTTCFAAAKGVVEKLVKADNTPLPNAVWKKLVHDLQVLYLSHCRWRSVHALIRACLAVHSAGAISSLPHSAGAISSKYVNVLEVRMQHVTHHRAWDEPPLSPVGLSVVGNRWVLTKH
jgi:hypothetical protein